MILDQQKKLDSKLKTIDLILLKNIIDEQSSYRTIYNPKEDLWLKVLTNYGEIWIDNNAKIFFNVKSFKDEALIEAEYQSLFDQIAPRLMIEILF